MRELVERPITHPEIYSFLGVQPPRGVLLHGPSGCGKTLLAAGTISLLLIVISYIIFSVDISLFSIAIAGELGVSFFKVSAPEIVSGVSGESEARLRQVFKEAALRVLSFPDLVLSFGIICRSDNIHIWNLCGSMFRTTLRFG